MIFLEESHNEPRNPASIKRTFQNLSIILLQLDEARFTKRDNGYYSFAPIKDSHKDSSKKKLGLTLK